MSDDQSDLVREALDQLDQSYAMLSSELAGCRDLCSSLSDTLARVRSNEKSILRALKSWDAWRIKLNAMLDAEEDAADWWKHGGEPPDA
jgi:septal ring factor EnvC (AmiA/AmiB activator)